MTTTYPKLTEAFPDFDVATLPAIPAGWDDCSWHNDACPSFDVADAEVQVFINYADQNLREYKGHPRFSVLSTADTTLDHCELLTDDWQAVLDFVAERSCTSHRDTGRGVCAHCGKVL